MVVYMNLFNSKLDVKLIKWSGAVGRVPNWANVVRSARIDSSVVEGGPVEDDSLRKAFALPSPYNSTYTSPICSPRIAISFFGTELLLLQPEQWWAMVSNGERDWVTRVTVLGHPGYICHVCKCKNYENIGRTGYEPTSENYFQPPTYLSPTKPSKAPAKVFLACIRNSFM
jgi:hypothetical protein